jgi:hypothetical protein
MREEQPMPETTATFSGRNFSIASALVIAESTE